jgi:putative membrane protein (TIGR04086 family)
MKAHSENGSLLQRLLRPVAIGTVVGALVCVLILMIMAAVMVSGVIPAKAVTPMAFVAAALGAFAGGFVAARLSRERGLLYGAATGFLLFLLTTAAGFALLPETGGTLLLLKLALMVGGGALGGILGVNLKRRR